MQPAASAEAASQALQRLALDLLDQGGDLPLPADAGPGEPGADGGFVPEVVLSLDDMVSDDRGQVILLNEAALSRLGIATDAPVMSRGTAFDHVLVDGEDTSGFSFVTFATGLTLYYPDGLELALLPSAA